jgi:Tannase-like family of unknown function (DUF6351)
MSRFASVLGLLAAMLVADSAQAALKITPLSSRADMVTAGDALVRVDVPRDTPKRDVRVRLNGRDVTSVFRAGHGGLTGLVTGLREGSNRLEATAGRGERARLELRNHPVQGPVFSGPHEQPFVCETESFVLPVIGGTLGAPLDEDCSIATRVDYFYRTTAGEFAAWPEDADRYPADLARTTTTLGREVPYVVRMETGTVNRSIYETAILHDPLGDSGPRHDRRPRGWNGRLIYTFGGGCAGGWYRQGNSTGGVTDDFMLRSGYAVASASLNVFGQNCQEVTSAETMMMVKERFTEAYGAPAHTQGFGCSGGSYQQHQIADNYPGLLDGILPGCSFPEVGFGTVNFITDAWLLDAYLSSAPGWTAEQKRSVTGFAVYATAPNVAGGARRIDPRVFCGVLPPAVAYDPQRNPGGARCDVYDHTINVYGRDPATGFARRPLDNVGIQYGLEAVNAGVITPSQFLDLNEQVGGFDADANRVPQRTLADPVATRRAYRSGRVTNGGLGLAEIPIVDYRAYFDDMPGGDIHVRYHSFSLRERLRKANGHARNQVMLVEDARYGLYDTRSPMLRDAILGLDRWITAVREDGSRRPPADKVVRNRPPGLREGCNTRDADPVFIAEQQVRDASSRCERLYPSASFPREVAGAGIAADVVKCRLEPVDARDYAVPFSAEERARLRRAFPQGVCDWTAPGIDQQPPAGTWLSFGPP